MHRILMRTSNWNYKFTFSFLGIHNSSYAIKGSQHPYVIYYLHRTLGSDCEKTNKHLLSAIG